MGRGLDKVGQALGRKVRNLIQSGVGSEGVLAGLQAPSIFTPKCNTKGSLQTPCL